MNICMFTNTYLPHVGGVARSVATFKEDLLQLGHRVLVIAPTFPNDYNDTDKDVHRVPAIQNFNGSDFSVRIRLPFIIDNHINDFKPDLIHSHHPYLLGDAALRAAYRRNLPIVFTHHTLYEKYTHYVPLASKVMKQLAIHLSSEYAKLCTQVIAPSESIAGIIADRGVKTPIKVIPTGVDSNYFRSGNGDDFRKRHAIPLNVPVIGHIGRLAPEKNLEYLSRAVIEALNKISVNARFLVVGSGPSENPIQKLFKDKGISERLVMVGNQCGHDLVNAYHAMNIFVFSSKSETQGMVLVEAMAAGIPVIALDAPGAREVVLDHQNGRLLPEDASIQLFADTVIDFFRSEHHANSWRKNASDTAHEFSRKVSAEKLVDVYQFLIDSKPQIIFKEDDVFEPWDKLLISLTTEWKLISEKAQVIKSVLQDQFSTE